MVIGKGDKGVVILKKKDAIEIAIALDRIEHFSDLASNSLKGNESLEAECAVFKSINDISLRALKYFKDV